MTKYTKSFDIDLTEMTLIEDALRSQVKSLSGAVIDDACEESGAKLRDVKDLLGRLHNQKVFYRPKGSYLGG